MPPIATQYFPFNGGLDLVTPPIERFNGSLRFGVNVEIGVRGGYATAAGYERYDGQFKPSNAVYSILTVTLTGTVNVGDVVNNLAVTVSGTVIAVGTGYLVLTKTVGQFSTGNLYVGATLVGTNTGAQQENSATTAALHAAYTALAANVYRALIGQLPGSGRVLGVHQYGGKVYAFRNNATGTAAVMYVATSSGWSAITLGREISFVQRQSTVTLTISSPGIVTWNNHGLSAGERVFFQTDGALPTGLSAGIPYFVVSPAANTFGVAATAGGTPINFTGTQSGTQTAYLIATQINDGDTITGLTSGATGVAQRVLLRSSTWTGSPAGSIVFTSVTGTFVNGEALSVGGTARVSASSADTAITLLPNGRYEFDNWNFGSQQNTERMYGCDGVNPGFEFDGTVYVPIHSGMTPDAPSHMQIHKNALFYSFKSSIQFSGPGEPYSFSPILGAGEFGCGDTITNLLSVPGGDTGGALVAKTLNRTFVLYGNDSSDFNLVPYSYEVGAEAYTIQLINGVYSFDTGGISSLATTQKFGNFVTATESDKINTYLNGKVGMSSASCISRKKSQYRLFFSDNEAVFVTFGGGKLLGMTTMSFPHDVTCISSMEGASRQEEIYFGSTDGYVRQAEIGTSFDGQAINWFANLTFNHFNSPRQLKRFRKAAVEVTGLGYAQFNMSSTIGYGSAEFSANPTELLTTISSPFNWDSFSWDQFIWDGLALFPNEADLYGTAENLSLYFGGMSDAFQPITLNSAIIHYTAQRLLR
ncbi:MAG TPA: hypothetical protein VN663_14415 [Ramlibacter sp.]|nr:hypothetical protein [Ramlibacter sp.]